MHSVRCEVGQRELTPPLTSGRQYAAHSSMSLSSTPQTLVVYLPTQQQQHLATLPLSTACHWVITVGQMTPVTRWWWW